MKRASRPFADTATSFLRPKSSVDGRRRLDGRLAALSDHRVVLALLLLAAFLVRLWFLNGRWINPDEGAHLMDGLLALEGYVPAVDYSSRQVFYVYALAFFLKVLGVGYEAARLYPVLATVAIGLLVYLISARLFDRRVALLAAAVYLFLPFTIAYGTQVKTEPLTILLSCVGIYAVLSALDRERSPALLALAGAAFGLAYYTRQSSLAVLLTALILLAVVIRRPLPLAKAIGSLAVGFLLICGGIIGWYATLLPPGEVLASSLNPVAFVADNVQGALGGERRGAAPTTTVLPGGEQPGADSAAPDEAETWIPIDRDSDQAWSVTVRNVLRTSNLNSVLLLALLLSPLPLLGGPTAMFRREDGARLRAVVLLYAWIGSLAVAYGFYSLSRGFFPAYFGEFLPALAILTAAVGYDAVSRLRSGDPPGVGDLLLIGFVALAFLILHLILGPLGIHRPLYYVAVPTVLGLVYLERRFGARQVIALVGLAILAVVVVLLAGRLGGAGRLVLYGLLMVSVFAVLLGAARVDPRRDRARSIGFVSYSLLAATFVLWMGASQAAIDRRFDGAWSPATVSAVAAYLGEISGPGDEVLSGAVIWELEARRHPFMLISHPLALRAAVGGSRQEAIEERLRTRPPEVIVLDGYTEQIYLAGVALLEELLESRYRLRRQFGGARYPVRVYALEEGGEMVGSPDSLRVPGGGQ